MPRGGAAGRLTSPDYGLGSASWDYLANGLPAKQTTDQETGLVALAYRYYEPGVGRFLNRDPVGFWGGENLYVYSGSEPILSTDPAGLFADILVGLLGKFCKWSAFFSGCTVSACGPAGPEFAADFVGEGAGAYAGATFGTAVRQIAEEFATSGLGLAWVVVTGLIGAGDALCSGSSLEIVNALLPLATDIAIAAGGGIGVLAGALAVSCALGALEGRRLCEAEKADQRE